MQDFVDDKEQHLVVRNLYAKMTAYYSVERAGKRITTIFMLLIKIKSS